MKRSVVGGVQLGSGVWLRADSVVAVTIHRFNLSSAFFRLLMPAKRQKRT